MKKTGFVAFVVGLLAFVPLPEAQQQRVSGGGSTERSAVSAALLQPTSHPAVPRDISQLWLAPSSGRGSALPALNNAIKLQAEGSYTKALAVLATPAADDDLLGDYMTYYAGVAHLRLGHLTEARRVFRSLAARPPVGYLVEASALGEADADEGLSNWSDALAIYERLVSGRIGPQDEVLMRLGRAARTVGDPAKAGEAFARVYYEFAASDLSAQARSELVRLSYFKSLSTDSERFGLELARAERLFSAKQYPAARNAFEDLRGIGSSDERALVGLRLAECDYFLKRPRGARDALRPYLTAGAREAEALFFHAVSSSDLGDKTEYSKGVRRLVDEFPMAPWTERALDSLATNYILQDDDDRADATFRDLYERFPKGAYADRAAWKIGWRAYREGKYGEAAQIFDRAAADFPRSDYRPSWLYWAGRAHEQLNERAIADERYSLSTADYLNSYYGRLASARLNGATASPGVMAVSTNVDAGDPSDPGRLPPNANVIRRLLEVELYDDALNELRSAARTGGDSPAIEATIAWINQRQGQLETGATRFTLVRGAITRMRRAYPQFMASGGEDLPREILSVIFPLGYWDLIRKYSSQNDLDPYLVAALVAQESTFVPDIKSYAKAVGLMQLMPFTGRQYAKRLGVRYSPSVLTVPETNIQLGTAYLADKVREFGDMYLALASYNAGESAVRRWLSERPGLARDEFIDDIPYPQTQNYVKRILGTAEDYRRLYSAPAAVKELLPASRLSPAAQGVGAPPAAGSAASKPPAKKAPAKKATTRKKTRKR